FQLPSLRVETLLRVCDSATSLSAISRNDNGGGVIRAGPSSEGQEGTSKLSMFGRIGIAAGASAAVGLWRLGTSLDSSIDQILTLQESSMQRELASISMAVSLSGIQGIADMISWILAKLHMVVTLMVNPRVLLVVIIIAILREIPVAFRTDSRRDFEGKFKYESKQAPNKVPFFLTLLSYHSMNTALDSMDPFDCVFGYPSMEEIPHPSNPSNHIP
ncbi:hypothetical protein F8388_024509, partial [Cannabis sativa]